MPNPREVDPAGASSGAMGVGSDSSRLSNALHLNKRSPRSGLGCQCAAVPVTLVGGQLENLSASGTSAPGSPTGAAGTRTPRRGKYVVEHKARAHGSIDKIDLDATQEIERDGIHEDVKTLRIQNAIVVGAAIGKSHAVAHTATATAADENADRLQFVVGIGKEFGHFFFGRRSEADILRAKDTGEFCDSCLRSGLSHYSHLPVT